MSADAHATGGGRRAGAALLGLALTLAGLALAHGGIDARAAAEPVGAAPALLLGGARSEVRGGMLLFVADDVARTGAWLRAAGAALTCAGAAMLLVLASRRGRPVAQRALGGALAAIALTAGVALAVSIGVTVESSAGAREAFFALAPAVALPAALAAARAA